MSLPDIFGYRLVVFDLDGTLYRQGPVRRGMAIELLRTGGTPGRLARLRLLRRFRHLREEIAATAPQGFDAALFSRLSAESGVGEADLRALVGDWMERRPLPRLAPARVPGTPELFDALRARGVTIAVWSDYPVADKLAALGLVADHHLAAGDADLGTLKPDPAGLALLMARTGTQGPDTLMVGDRMERDGAAAAALGVDFLMRSARAPSTGLGPGQFHVRDFRPFLAPGRSAAAA